MKTPHGAAHFRCRNLEAARPPAPSDYRYSAAGWLAKQLCCLKRRGALCAAPPLDRVELERAWTAREAAAATAWWQLRLKKTFIEARSPLMPFRCAPQAP